MCGYFSLMWCSPFSLHTNVRTSPRDPWQIEVEINSVREWSVRWEVNWGRDQQGKGVFSWEVIEVLQAPAWALTAKNIKFDIGVGAAENLSATCGMNATWWHWMCGSTLWVEAVWAVTFISFKCFSKCVKLLCSQRIWMKYSFLSE